MQRVGLPCRSGGLRPFLAKEILFCEACGGERRVKVAPLGGGSEQRRGPADNRPYMVS